MQPLNEQNLCALVDLLTGSTNLNPPCGAAIIEYPAEVILTDGALLLSWAKKQVDGRSKLYQALVKEGKNTTSYISLLRGVTDWRKLIITGKLHPAEELDPGDDTPDGCVTYLCRTRRRHYRHEYTTAIEGFLNSHPERDIFDPKSPADLHHIVYRCHPTEGSLTHLCALENDNLVGLVANSIGGSEKSNKDNLHAKKDSRQSQG